MWALVFKLFLNVENTVLQVPLHWPTLTVEVNSFMTYVFLYMFGLTDMGKWGFMILQWCANIVSFSALRLDSCKQPHGAVSLNSMPMVMEVPQTAGPWAPGDCWKAQPALPAAIPLALLVLELMGSGGSPIHMPAGRSTASLLRAGKTDALKLTSQIFLKVPILKFSSSPNYYHENWDHVPLICTSCINMKDIFNLDFINSLGIST